ncbi:hypothetical protein P4O66_001090 [Electrophorus voltai]|uniref:Uncharacterized protein n=1 Tax=Electrophorus voltai TaxID=2609070 RepID=A0AAD8ZC45_9TELE|nr:hypothetical protein P4O66_001090 [Electrophorus voltai]
MYCIALWGANRSAGERKALQRVITTAQKITGCSLPSLADLFSSCCLSKSANILKDPSNPGHQQFNLLPIGRRFRSITSQTDRFKNSFYHRATCELNTTQQQHGLFGTCVDSSLSTSKIDPLEIADG